ncbi:hypothetical protein [Streptomyces sp. NBC_00197]|uniref:DUF7239 family protein n=1 Tax=Streptomyces sp. NBC_00197 TaxID=2975676 RepID=UPI003250E7AF
MPDPRESRLPKWAQQELSRLRRDLDIERQTVEELRGNIPDTDTFALDYIRGNSPLPKGSRVGFHPRPDDDFGRLQIQVYCESGRLRVQGDYALTVRPSASNSLTIEIDRYR